MALKTIIDANKLPSAVTYYQTFPREPSPAGDMIVGPATIAAVSGLSLERILDQMALLNAGDEVLLVCHGTNSSLLLPLTATTQVDAWFKGLDMIWHAMRTQDELKGNTSLSDWQKRVGRFGVAFKGREGHMPTLADAKKRLNFLINDIAKISKITRSEVDLLISKLRAVHKKPLKRIEIRACNVASGNWGRARPQLRTLLRFFGCGKLVAPVTSTFYTRRFGIEAVANSAGVNNWFGSFSTTHAPAALPGLLSQQQWSVNPMNASGQPRLIKKLNSAKTRIFNQDFLLALWELRPSELYAAGSATIARPNASGGVAVPDWNRVQKFVRDFINPSHGTVNSPFPIAGFWNTGGQDFVLPNEDAYKKALVSVIK